MKWKVPLDFLKNFLDENGVKYKENARSLIFTCPCCGGKDKLYIDKENNRSICFRQKTEDCPRPSNSLYKTLGLLCSLPPQKIQEVFKNDGLGRPFFDDNIDQIPPITEEFCIDVPQQKPLLNINKTQLKRLEPKDMPVGMVDIDKNEALEGRLYLTNQRGLNINALKKYQIGYIPQRKRVVFPVIMHSDWYGWQARTILPNVEPRMYNLPGPWKSHTLMFFDNLLRSNHAILAEGAVSALKFEMVGGFVATMGKMVSLSQVNLLMQQKNISTIYLALDRDAILNMITLADIIRSFNSQVKLKLIKTPSHREDFGDASYDECEKAFLNSEDIDWDNFLLYNYAMENL